MGKSNRLSAQKGVKIGPSPWLFGGYISRSLHYVAHHIQQWGVNYPFVCF